MKVYKYKRYRVQVLADGYRVMRGETEIAFKRSLWPSDPEYKAGAPSALEEAIRAIDEDRSKKHGQRKGD